MNADVEVEADRLCGEVANNVALSPETVAMKMRIKSLKQTPVHMSMSFMFIGHTIIIT